MKQLTLTLAGMLAMPLTQAAGFDCNKASLPIEKAICADQSLSQADEQMSDAYTFLLAQCRDIAAHTDVRAAQRAWLAGIRKDYGEGSPEALDRLGAAYRARNDALARLLAECNQDHGPVRATVRTLQLPGEQPLLFVETNPPESGWRINKVLYHNYHTVPPLEFSGLISFLATHKAADNNDGKETFSLVSNKGNLLVLRASGTNCEPDAPRCSPFDYQYRFDIRTGSVASFDDLYTEEGAYLLSQKLKEKLINLAKSKLTTIPKKDAEANRDQYQRCLDSWRGRSADIAGNFTADGRLQFSWPNCSSYTPYGPDPEEPEGQALDNLILTVALPELSPYLSTYGKSILLGEGDVRAPISEAPLVCKKEGLLEVRRNDRASVPGIQASAWEDHYLLLMPDGKLWGWGEGQAGQLGAPLGRHLAPRLLEGDFLQVGAGPSFTAAIQRDGTLWTWGANYQYRLGDGTDKPRAHRVRVGEGFVSLKVATNGTIALKQDGTVWGWGNYDMTTPQQLISDVVQIENGQASGRLLLKKDGSLWALGGSYGYPILKASGPKHLQIIGNGFTHLPVHGDLAFKTDGSLWAWNRLRYTSFRLGDENSFEQPVNIGNGFVNVKVSLGDPSHVAALKADGSLWLAKTRGAITRLEPVGCGYADLVVSNEVLLTLKQDGSLEIWSHWETPAAIAQQEQRELIAPWGRLHPIPLGKGYFRLFQVSDLGGGSAQAIALRQDGSVWLFNPRQAPAEARPKDWFVKVPFPQEANIGK